MQVDIARVKVNPDSLGQNKHKFKSHIFHLDFQTALSFPNAITTHVVKYKIPLALFDTPQ
jgi:hypothetical protein